MSIDFMTLGAAMKNTEESLSGNGVMKGEPGEKGTDGKSAYQIWLDEGNVGTEQDFLASLKGIDGTMTFEDLTEEQKESLKGEQGQDGKSAYQIWLDLGNDGTEEDFLEFLKGENGPIGESGSDGRSAYEIWIDEGNSGTEQDFLDSLKGEKGADGTMTFADLTEEQKESLKGEPGADGTDGKSAYDIWLDAGNTGSEEDFLDSLRGDPGDMGESGSDGASAYEIWIDEGNSGTEQDFLDSLKGEPGEKGEDGSKNIDDENVSTDTTWSSDKIASELGGKVYTSLAELELMAPTTVGEVFMAMPEKSMLMLNVEALVDDGTNELTVTDVPKEFGVLTIEKHIYGRFRIEYSNSLGGAVFNARKWIGTLKGSDGTGLVWKEVNTGNHKYTTMAELGLDGSTATIQDVIDKVAVGDSVMIRTDAFNNNNWQTQCNGIQWGYLKIEKTMNGLSNIELQEVITPNRRYFGTQSSGKFVGWVATTGTKGLVTNAQNFKLDITKNHASWYGFFKLEYLYGTELCQVDVGIANTIDYRVTKGTSHIDKITYTVNGANIVLGIDFIGKVYGVQVVEMPSEFGTINSLTAEQFTGDTSANLKLDSARTYTTLAELGLTADATFQDVISALPKGSSALLGVTEFTNYQTIFPYKEGNDQFARVYTVKGSADGSRMYARWFRKDGVKEAIAIFNINDNKFAGWQSVIVEDSKTDPYSCTGYKALTGTEDLFTLPCGHYVSDKVNTTYNYPITDSSNVTAHIYVLGCLNEPANNKGYRIILYFDNKGRMYRINEWWGSFSNGWKEIVTKDYVDSKIADLQAQINALK